MRRDGLPQGYGAAGFWTALDELVESSTVEIDRPDDSRDVTDLEAFRQGSWAVAVGVA